jgi:hypothetical protein
MTWSESKIKNLWLRRIIIISLFPFILVLGSIVEIYKFSIDLIIRTKKELENDT